MTGVMQHQQNLRVVLLGIDGAGKTTVARTVLRALQDEGQSGHLFRNPGGRRTLNRWASHFSTTAEALLGVRALDALESCLRVCAVVRSEWSARRLLPDGGVVIFDRHLWCQLALREVRGLRGGVVLPWLLRALPQPDLVVYLGVEPIVAMDRIASRATDEETLEFLTGLDAAYRSLEEFSGFVEIDGNGSSGEAAAAFQAIVHDRLLRTGLPAL